MGGRKTDDDDTHERHTDTNKLTRHTTLPPLVYRKKEFYKQSLNFSDSNSRTPVLNVWAAAVCLQALAARARAGPAPARPALGGARPHCASRKRRALAAATAAAAADGRRPTADGRRQTADGRRHTA